MRGQRKNPRKAVQPFENKKRKIDIFKNYEANGVEKIQRKLEIFSTLISKKSTKIFQHFSKLGAFRRIGNVVANQKMCVHNSPFESNTAVAFAFYDSSCKFIDLPLKNIL